MRPAVSLKRPRPGERSKRVEGADADIYRGISIARSEVRSMLMNPLRLLVAH